MSDLVNPYWIACTQCYAICPPSTNPNVPPDGWQDHERKGLLCPKCCRVQLRVERYREAVKARERMRLADLKRRAVKYEGGK